MAEDVLSIVVVRIYTASMSDRRGANERFVTSSSIESVFFKTRVLEGLDGADRSLTSEELCLGCSAGDECENRTPLRALAMVVSAD